MNCSCERALVGQTTKPPRTRPPGGCVSILAGRQPPMPVGQIPNYTLFAFVRSSQ